MNDQSSRIILAVAAQADDEFIWHQVETIQMRMFSAGPLAIKFAYFGREGASQIRPYITTRWVADAELMRDMMNRARADCRCGCYVQIGDILEQALREARQGPVRAVVIIGDSFHGDLDTAIATAKRLRAAGTRVFVFQQGDSGTTERAFEMLAEVTGGAYLRFNPHVEKVAERLPERLEAIAHYAIGGKAALKGLDTNDSRLLLEQLD